MDQKLEQLIRFIASRAEQESTLLYGNHARWVVDAHEVIQEMQKLWNLSEYRIDTITIEEQNK